MRRKIGIVVVLLGMMVVCALASLTVEAQATMKLSQFALRGAVDSNSYFAGVEDSGGVFLNKLFSGSLIAAYMGGSGVNWNKASLIWNGDYTQDVAKHAIILDSVNQFVIKDTFGYYPLNINTPSLLGSSGFYTNYDGTIGDIVVHPAGSSMRFELIAGLGGPNTCSLSSFGKSLFYGDSMQHVFEVGNYSGPNYGVLIDLNIGAVRVDNAYALPQIDGIPGQVPVTNGSGSVAFTDLRSLGLVTSYNGSATAGNGLEAVRANNDATGLTFASSITSVTASGTYVVNGYVNITAVVTDVLNVQITFTDENNNPQTLKVLAPGATGVAGIALGAVRYYPLLPVTVRAKTGTLIIVSTVLATGGGSITYDAGATITQIN